MAPQTVVKFKLHRGERSTPEYRIRVTGTNLSDIGKCIASELELITKPSIEDMIGGRIERMTIELTIELTSEDE